MNPARGQVLVAVVSLTLAAMAVFLAGVLVGASLVPGAGVPGARPPGAGTDAAAHPASAASEEPLAAETADVLPPPPQPVLRTPATGDQPARETAPAMPSRINPLLAPLDPPPGSADPPRYGLQVGVYASRASAEAVRGLMEAAGHAARVLESVDARQRPWYRVRVGDFATREAAGVGASRLARATGFPVDVVVRPAEPEENPS